MFSMGGYLKLFISYLDNNFSSELVLVFDSIVISCSLVALWRL